MGTRDERAHTRLARVIPNLPEAGWLPGQQRVFHMTYSPVSLSKGMILRAQRGEAAAMEALYHRHAAWVYTLCRNVTNQGEGEELTQAVFMNTFRKLTDVKNESDFANRLRTNTIRLLTMLLVPHARGDPSPEKLRGPILNPQFGQIDLC